MNNRRGPLPNQVGSGRPVRARFDELVALSGLGRSLDTPFKYHSLGMTTRLTFAIAAHLDAELLLVDEVFSFGDLPFREHCVARMRHLAAAEGRAVVMVSQEMRTIRQCCPRTILMRDGMVAADGLVEDVVYQYLTPSR